MWDNRKIQDIRSSEFGLSPQSWQYLLSASVNGAGFFWHQWEKSNLAAQLINQTLAKILP